MQTGIVTLVYQKNHYGHEIDLGHLGLSKEERQATVQQLAQGVPVETVLKGVRKSLGRELQKILLITRRDLYNIARRELGVTLPQLKEGLNTPYLKDVKLELPSESSNSCSYYLDKDIDESADHAPEKNENHLVNLPGVGFQISNQLPLSPVDIGKQGTAPLDFGVVNWETGDCGAMEEISFDDEEEPQLQDLSESSYFRDTSEGQSTFTVKQKSKPCRQDHVYTKLSE
ncbi:hypothetical protein MRX96_021942 [Rhipicephalus microplus]